MVMEDEKKIFCERATTYFSDVKFGNSNVYQSATFDLLNICVIFGLVTEVKNMFFKKHFFKLVWKNMFWTKGWQLEDMHWRIERQLQRSLDILSGVSPITRYLTWWSVSDKFPKYMKECEILAKLTCHARELKGDDFKLKGLPGTAQMCDLCNAFEVEDARHFLLRCPNYFECERVKMLREINQIKDDAGPLVGDNGYDMRYTILGRPYVELNEDQMMKIWLVILKSVSTMYKKNMECKRGIG